MFCLQSHIRSNYAVFHFLCTVTVTHYLRHETEETSAAPASNSIKNFATDADTIISLLVIPFTNYIALFITTFFHQQMTKLHICTSHPKNV